MGGKPWSFAAEECEVWRGDVIREIAKKVAEIQNAALGDFEHSFRVEHRPHMAYDIRKYSQNSLKIP